MVNHGDLRSVVFISAALVIHGDSFTLSLHKLSLFTEYMSVFENVCCLRHIMYWKHNILAFIARALREHTLNTANHPVVLLTQPVASNFIIQYVSRNMRV